MYDFNDPMMRTLIIGAVLSLPLKIVSLWRSARHDQKGWFATLMIVNSLGLLELVYLFYFSNTKTKD